MVRISVDLDISEEEFAVWNKKLAENADSPEKLFSKFVHQYNLFGRCPLVDYSYGEIVEAPQILDFSRKPLSLIHPLKRRAVEVLLLSNIPTTIEKIIIFGSAVTLYCHPGSDLDICIIGSYKLTDEHEQPWLKKFSRQMGPKDILVYNPKDFKNKKFGLQKDIVENGVVVYEKKTIDDEYI